MAPRGCHKMGPGEAHAGMALVFLKPNVWLHLSPALRGDATQGRTPSTAPAARPGPAGAVGAARMQPPGWLQGEGCEGEAAARTAPCTCCCQNLSCLRRQQRAASSQPQASLLSSGRGAAIAEMVSYKKKKAPPFFFFFFAAHQPAVVVKPAFAFAQQYSTGSNTLHSHHLQNNSLVRKAAFPVSCCPTGDPSPQPRDVAGRGQWERGHRGSVTA